MADNPAPGAADSVSPPFTLAPESMADCIRLLAEAAARERAQARHVEALLRLASDLASRVGGLEGSTRATADQVERLTKGSNEFAEEVAENLKYGLEELRSELSGRLDELDEEVSHSGCMHP